MNRSEWLKSTQGEIKLLLYIVMLRIEKATSATAGVFFVLFS
jgi:hypothetical protein